MTSASGSCRLASENPVSPKEIDLAAKAQEPIRKEPGTAHVQAEGVKMVVTKKRKFRSPALQHTYGHHIGHDPKLVAEYEEEVINADIARKIYDLRTKAELSQRQLAAKIGTTALVICRLEDADYDGHSLGMLKRIADALDKRVEIRFVPIRKIRSKGYLTSK
jgi:ribosome-binding protein aMBF1 (putative translation factor)